ncbi:MAG: single-stranded-DNA-specific exonuclease RecJ [Alphaproteobacteria bacterium]|nr:single-stranded-DNA-specific exonuclease RecJ [Alphaproteobacteria bacterium]
MKEVCGSSFSEKRWVLRPCDDALILSFIQKLEISETLARLLVMRHQTLESSSLFLEPSLRRHLPDPLILKDMKKAIQRLHQAIKAGEKILVWGDYDVDGATSSALLYRFFKAIGVPIALYIPDRIREGYGPNIAGIQKFIREGYTVMVTVDCGTTSFDAIEGAIGMDVIVLDHHAPETRLPKAYALVNPNRLDEDPLTTQTLGHLAAVGISFLCIVALNRTLREEGFYKIHQEPDLLSLLDLVALGTVCDVMSLTGLNRTFVSQGLKVMAKRQNIGLKALADIGGFSETPSPYHLGFVLGPRINAGGRVGESFLGARLLSTESLKEAFEISQKLDIYNQERRLLERGALEEALVQVDPGAPFIVVDREGWHEGVIGIVAGRLKEKYHKPTAVITWNEDGIGKASARSIPGFDFGQFIHKAYHLGYLLGGGGHAMAAGFSLTKEHLLPFKEFLASELEKIAQNIDLSPLVLCDGYLDLASLTPTLLEEINKLSPFGIGNPGPKFIFSDVVVSSYTLIKDEHIKCRFTQGDGVNIEGIGFRLKGSPLGDILMEAKGRPLELLASPKLDIWGGKAKITLMIEDVAIPSLGLKKAG